ncbi:hypothetical protein H4582DRAFT_446308 [Lactarius indigo]|nr:hypothetical protein H4582DRAFT_446308 [Lactarius indigo]
MPKMVSNRICLTTPSRSPTPVSKNLSCWPAFPLVIKYVLYLNSDDEEDFFAAPEHPNRVRSIILIAEGPLLVKVAIEMQKPFLGLTRLYLSSIRGDLPVLPRGYLSSGSILCGYALPVRPLARSWATRGEGRRSLLTNIRRESTERQGITFMIHRRS